MKISAVFFDIGETLIDETRPWSLLADWLGVPRMTLFAVLGRVIADGRGFKEVLPAVRPDLTWPEVSAGFEEEVDNRYLVEDLYADARPCLEELQRAGCFIAGNQPPERESDLMAMELPSDLIATSGRWGVKKPDAAFFDRIVSESGSRLGRSSTSGTAWTTMSFRQLRPACCRSTSYAVPGGSFSATGRK